MTPDPRLRPPSGSLQVGITSPIQAHVSLEEALVEVRHRYASTLACLEARLDLPGRSPGTRLTVQPGIAHYRVMLAFLAAQGPRLMREHQYDAAEKEHHA